MVGLFYLDMSFNICLVTGLTTLWFTKYYPLSGSRTLAAVQMFHYFH